MSTTFSDLFRTLLVVCLLVVAGCSSLPGKKTAFGDGMEIGESESDDDSADSDAPRAETPVAKADRHAPLPKVLAPSAEADAKKALPEYQQALQLLKSGKDDQALIMFRSLTAAYPSLTGPALNQALILQHKGQLQEAAKVLKKAAYGPTRDPRVMNQLGVVSRMNGQFQEARQAYQAALRLAPGYDKAHYNLAILADLYLGDLTLAIAEFEKYQSLQDTRDKKVDGWLKDLRRRAAAP